jgi:CheY-like chemotaxis protein
MQEALMKRKRRPQPQPLRGVHVLVVEDHDDSRYILEQSLEYCGAVVMAVASATEALRVMQRTRPDIIIADIAMPVYDGIWLLRQLRAQQQATGRYVPVVALTASMSRPTRTDFDEVLFKPCHIDTICAVILRLTRPPDPGSEGPAS